MRQRAPYFSLARAAWVPCVLRWDEVTSEFQRLEGAEGFQGYRQAAEASRFLVRTLP